MCPHLTEHDAGCASDDRFPSFLPRGRNSMDRGDIQGRLNTGGHPLCPLFGGNGVSPPESIKNGKAFPTG